MDKKIAEIQKIIWHLHLHCFVPLEDGECETCDKSIKTILALIEHEQAKHNTTRWYTAKKHYDEGTETQEDRDILSGAIDTLDCQECMKQAQDFAWEAGLKLGIEAERERQAPMVEALKEAKKDLETIQGGEGPYNRDPLKHLENCYEHMIEIAGKAIANIDAVLPKGEGK